MLARIRGSNEGGEREDEMKKMKWEESNKDKRKRKISTEKEIKEKREKEKIMSGKEFKEKRERKGTHD